MTIKAINVRNQFKGTIKEIVEGDVLSEIDVQTASRRLPLTLSGQLIVFETVFALLYGFIYLLKYCLDMPRHFHAAPLVA